MRSTRTSGVIVLSLDVTALCTPDLVTLWMLSQLSVPVSGACAGDGRRGMPAGPATCIAGMLVGGADPHMAASGAAPRRGPRDPATAGSAVTGPRVSRRRAR